MELKLTNKPFKNISIMHYRSYYVFGCGKKGIRVLALLRQAEIKVKAFIVSFGEKHEKELFGIPVIELSNIKHNSFEQDSVVLIATSEKHRDAIEENLKNTGITRFRFVDNLLLNELKSLAKPIENAFFTKTEPISRVFGCDRGTPVDRYYIEKYLEIQRVQNAYDETYRILEIGEDTYSRRFIDQNMLSDFESDILDYSKGEDLTEVSTLKKNYYDLFICTQTFNFIFNVKEAIAGAFYTLKHGGTLLATVAGTITPISRYDMDRWGHFWGFTDVSAKRLFSEVFGEENVEVFSYGNALAATAFIQGASVEDLDDPHMLDEIDMDYQVLLGITVRK